MDRAWRVVLAMVVVGGGAACTDDPEPEVTGADYVAALAAICTETTARLDAIPPPADDATAAAFAAAVAVALRDEAESARALAVPDDLDGDHRAFVRNTDEQAARWAELSATASTADAFEDLTRQIGELTLGRDDLVAEMGVDACARSRSS